MEYTTHAIVLRHHDTREYDRVFRLYTRHLGKVAVQARGVRRLTSKMAGHLEPFALVTVKVVEGKDGRYILSNVETVRRYQHILQDVSLIRLAKAATRLVDDVMDDHACDISALQLLDATLQYLNQSEQPLLNKRLVVSMFGLQLVSHLGHRPLLDRCVVCGQAADTADGFFDPHQGGYVCATHQSADYLPLPSAARQVLVHAAQPAPQRTALPSLSADTVNQSITAMNAFIRGVQEQY